MRGEELPSVRFAEAVNEGEGVALLNSHGGNRDVERRGRALTVRFGDGAKVVFDSEGLLSSGVRDVDWDALTSCPYEIILPTSTEPVEIPGRRFAH